MLHSAQARLEAADSKSEPPLQALSVIRSVDLICHLWQQYVNTALLPLASSSVTVRREMVVFNNQTSSRIEGAVNTLTQRLTDCPFLPSFLSPNPSLMIYHLHFSRDLVAFRTTRKTETERLQTAERRSVVCPRQHRTVRCVL
jgi:hypothetical protein